MTTIWSEMVRVRKSRCCLQNVVTPVSIGSLNDALNYCISFVQNCSESQQKSTLFDYTCLILGYSAFYSLKWTDVISIDSLLAEGNQVLEPVELETASLVWARALAIDEWLALSLLLTLALTAPLPQTHQIGESQSCLFELMFVLIDSDWDSIRVLPSSSSRSVVVDHTCILKITDQRSATTMRQYIRSHLIEWNSTSRYFTNCRREYCILE